MLRRFGGGLFACVSWLALGSLLHAKEEVVRPVLQDLGALQSALTAAVEASKAPGAAWGIQVVSLKTGTVWYATNSSRLLVPASNSKLFSVALALDRFGTGHVFTTTLRAGSAPDGGGRVAGDLWIEPGGDPAPGGGVAELAALDPYVAALSKAGVRSIAGGVRIGSGLFDADPFGPGWNWDDLPEAYGAPIGPVVFGGNAAKLVVRGAARAGEVPVVRIEPVDGIFDVQVSAVTVPTNRPARIQLRRLPGSRRLEVRGEIHPGATHAERMAVPDAPEWFGRALREALVRGKIPMNGESVGSGALLPGSVVLARVNSSPMAELAALCLKPSDNLIAHQLWLHVGADVRRRPRNGEASGRGDDSERASAALGRFLAGLGISANEVTLEEGSGLSRKNLVTPSATVRLLRSMVNHPAGAAYRAALPVGGVDGTLKSRFTQPGLRGNVMAKTGTLRHVNALGGYLTTAGGQPLAFAIYVNGFHSADPASSGRAEMDRMVELLARFAGRGPE